MSPAAKLRILLLASLFAAPALAPAQEAPPLPQSSFVYVTSEGTLRLRHAPSTDAPVITELDPGALLRNLGCAAAPDPWCQVQSLDGAQAGWVAASYLAPFAGADPAALSSPAVSATETRQLDLRAGLLFGTLAPGGIHDLITAAPPDQAVTLSLDAPGNIGIAAFVRPATLLARGDPGTPLSLVLPEGGDLLIRLVDRSGAGGDWRLSIALD
ncbi:SH3 domain-containing protein [Salipiger mangrovisoli]|uniref:SH3 domain-containing protein n=1 Tax=Salipiger mangrovisoli TaxID=2865933 RepID=A0ABR9X4H2_9RHOB|nr:SH3 domain-containing protein [Salipiger mangrovisoli]MBE9638485.1 SH3 domain-containing protein [Salipiger mangrovisoli]